MRALAPWRLLLIFAVAGCDPVYVPTSVEVDAGGGDSAAGGEADRLGDLGADADTFADGGDVRTAGDVESTGGDAFSCTPFTECRPATGPCDVAEQCSSTGGCPPDLSLDDGQPCASVGYCCAGTCVDPTGSGSVHGAACGSGDCTGTWECNGAAARCSSYGSACDSCADGETRVAATCTGDVLGISCAAGTATECDACVLCVDEGPTATCSGVYDPGTDDATGTNTCAGKGLSCDGVGCRAELEVDGTVDASTWVNGSGNQNCLHCQLNDSSSDSYVQGTSTDGIAKFTLQDIADPQLSTRHVIWVLARKISGTAGGGVQVQLRQGSSLIATLTTSLTSSYRSYTHTLTPSEADSISNYANLQFWISETTGDQDILVPRVEFWVPVP